MIFDETTNALGEDIERDLQERLVMDEKFDLRPFDIRDEAARLEAKGRFDGNLLFGARRFHVSTHRSGDRNDGPADGAMVPEQALVIEDSGQDRYRRTEGFWEPVPVCPICGCSKREFFLSRFGIDIYACASCTHHYMDPRITFEKLTQLYASDQTAARVYKSDMQMRIDEVKSAYGLEIIEQLSSTAQDRIMDLGCGSGQFLKVAHRRGWSCCVGVDANSEYKDSYQNSEGIQFISSTFEGLDRGSLGSDYDAITLWNVLEHLYDVKAIVGELKNLLKPGGLLFIMVPNARSLATRLIRERSATFNWKHVSHFTPDSLQRLMADHGLRCELLETAVSEIENVKSYLSGAWPYSGHGDPEGLFDFITPEYLHKNLLGSRLIGVFRR